MFNKNVVFQYKLTVVLAETQRLHLGKMREVAQKASKILDISEQHHQQQEQQQQQ